MAHIDSVGIRGLVPRRVESPNSAGEVSPAVIFWLDVGRILRYSIIVRIYGLNEYLFVKINTVGCGLNTSNGSRTL